MDSAHQCRARRGSIDHTIDTGPERPHPFAGCLGYWKVRLPPAEHENVLIAKIENQLKLKTRTKLKSIEYSTLSIASLTFKRWHTRIQLKLRGGIR